MSYSVKLSPNFEKKAKKLSRKYPSLKSELKALFEELEKNPTLGVPLGNDMYKIRLAIASKNKGKSGGARILSFIKIMQSAVLLFAIYSKGEEDTLTDKQIKELIKGYY